MNKKELKKIIESFGNEWYYYYNFDGIEVRSKFKDSKTDGMNNWKDKLKPIIADIASEFNTPCLFDIGCNMALYAHEMTKMGITVLAADKNIEIAKFFSRYITENTDEEWKTCLLEYDIINDKCFYPGVDIVTMFCMIYHLYPYEEQSFAKLSKLFPNHKYVVMQGNNPRVKRKKRPQSLAGVKGMSKLMEKYGYEIVGKYKWDGYQKPVVVGRRTVG